MDKYYMIGIHYSQHSPGKSISGHVVRATSDEEAEKIITVYGISNPRFASDIIKINIRRLDRRKIHVKRLLQNRRLKRGGSIWYVENNQLKEETNDPRKNK